MWGIIPPLSVAEASRSIWTYGDPSHRIDELHSEVIELTPDIARGPGSAWVYRNEKSLMARDLYSGRGQGTLFARRQGSGFGITYNTVNESKVGRVAKFANISARLALLRVKPNTYRIGGPANIARLAGEHVKQRCVIQVIAMSRSSFTGRSDGVQFVDSNYLAYNYFLNVLVDVGIINTDMIRPSSAKKDGIMSRLRGKKENVMDISGFESRPSGGLAD